MCALHGGVGFGLSCSMRPRDAVNQARGSSSGHGEIIKPELLRKKELTVIFSHLILPHTGGNPNGEEEKGGHPNGLLEKRSACPTGKIKPALSSRHSLKAKGCSNRPKWNLERRKFPLSILYVWGMRMCFEAALKVCSYNCVMGTHIPTDAPRHVFIQ